MKRKELEQHVRARLAEVADLAHQTDVGRSPFIAVYEDYLLLIQELREARAQIEVMMVDHYPPAEPKR